MAERQGSRFEQIGSYYEEPATLCWEVTCKGHQHSGYWDASNAEGAPWEGPRRLTEIMVEAAEIGPGQRFLDLGSGFGLPALELARRKGCAVEGVNASRYQTDKANASAAAEGLAERVRFRVADALELPFEDASFDGAWFLESIFHMGHAAALAEARRVLRPGAVLLITDFVNHQGTSEAFLELQRDILLAEHGSKEAYPDLLREAGFELLRLEDWTEPVIRRSDAKNRAAFELHEAEMLGIAEADYLPFIQEVSDLFARNAGYVFVKAKAV